MKRILLRNTRIVVLIRPILMKTSKRCHSVILLKMDLHMTMQMRASLKNKKELGRPSFPVLMISWILAQSITGRVESV